MKEKDGLARPFFVEDNAFSTDPDNFYNPDKNNFSPRLSATYAIDPKTALRAGFGLFYGPGQFEDRIQPIENYIERRRVQAATREHEQAVALVHGPEGDGHQADEAHPREAGQQPEAMQVPVASSPAAARRAWRWPGRIPMLSNQPAVPARRPPRKNLA